MSSVTGLKDNEWVPFIWELVEWFCNTTWGQRDTLGVDVHWGQEAWTVGRSAVEDSRNTILPLCQLVRSSRSQVH